MCLFLGSACFTKPPSPASVPSIENGMPLKQRKVSVSPSYDVTNKSHDISFQNGGFTLIFPDRVRKFGNS